jgi:hypothetical protein
LNVLYRINRDNRIFIENQNCPLPKMEGNSNISKKDNPLEREKTLFFTNTMNWITNSFLSHSILMNEVLQFNNINKFYFDAKGLNSAFLFDFKNSKKGKPG